MSSRKTPWLLPNRYITDDTGTRIRVTGRLLIKCSSLSLTGFTPYNSGDSVFKKLATLVFTLILLCGLILVMDYLASASRNMGCWMAPITLVVFFGLFHLFRVITGRRGDEEVLQQAVTDCRNFHPDQCPACDGCLTEIDNDEYLLCQICGAGWHKTTSP